MIARPLVLTVVSAAALVLAAPPTPGFADNLPTPYYSLKYDPSSPTAAPIQQVFFSLSPPGQIAEQKDANGNIANPLIVLKGFDPGSVNGGVLDGTIPAGQPSAGQFQAIGLDFGTPGFQPNSEMDFSLKLKDPSSGSLPTLTLLDPSTLLKEDNPQITPLAATSGLTLDLVNGTGTGTGSGSSSNSSTPSTPSTLPSRPPVPPTIPEPLSLVIWSALAGLGLMRIKTLRRSRRAAA
ncbi:MAG: hypothetical protein JO034_03835 [Singulisphaera sp.]|nr:hypothetical protein [Singulisphaera sp.]